MRRVRNKVCVGAAFQFSATLGDGRRRQGLADRLRPELGEDAPQRAHARGNRGGDLFERERMTVVLDDFVKLLVRAAASSSVSSRFMAPIWGRVVDAGGSPQSFKDRCERGLTVFPALRLLLSFLDRGRSS